MRENLYHLRDGTDPAAFGSNWSCPSLLILYYGAAGRARGLDENSGQSKKVYNSMRAFPLKKPDKKLVPAL